jgi:hypothetical protein
MRYIAAPHRSHGMAASAGAAGSALSAETIGLTTNFGRAATPGGTLLEVSCTNETVTEGVEEKKLTGAKGVTPVLLLISPDLLSILS